MVRLLLVDDEPVTRKGLLELVPWVALGVGAIESAANGAEALEAALRSRPDIVVTDIKMPKLTGIELARRLRLMLPGCRIVLLSGCAEKGASAGEADLPIAGILEKPIKRGELAAIVQRLVAEIEAG